MEKTGKKRKRKFIKDSRQEERILEATPLPGDRPLKKIRRSGLIESERVSFTLGGTIKKKKEAVGPNSVFRMKTPGRSNLPPQITESQFKARTVNKKLFDSNTQGMAGLKITKKKKSTKIVPFRLGVSRKKKKKKKKIKNAGEINIRRSVKIVKKKKKKKRNIPPKPVVVLSIPKKRITSRKAETKKKKKKKKLKQLSSVPVLPIPTYLESDNRRLSRRMSRHTHTIGRIR